MGVIVSSCWTVWGCLCSLCVSDVLGEDQCDRKTIARSWISRGALQLKVWPQMNSKGPLKGVAEVPIGPWWLRGSIWPYTPCNAACLCIESTMNKVMKVFMESPHGKSSKALFKFIQDTGRLHCRDCTSRVGEGTTCSIQCVPRDLALPQWSH